MRSKNKTRQQLLEPKSKESPEKITVVTKFSTKSMIFRKIINKHWSLLQHEPDFGNIFGQQPRFAYTRGQNLGEMLRTEGKDKQKSVYKGMTPCYNCNNCSNVIRGNTITHPTKGTKIQLRVNATCDTMNCIYMVKCPCGKIYVGQTERKIKVRINEHKSNIRTGYSKSTIAMHFAEARHDISQLRFCILEMVDKRKGQ